MFSNITHHTPTIFHTTFNLLNSLSHVFSPDYHSACPILPSFTLPPPPPPIGNIAGITLK